MLDSLICDVHREQNSKIIIGLISGMLFLRKGSGQAFAVPIETKYMFLLALESDSTCNAA